MLRPFALLLALATTPALALEPPSPDAQAVADITALVTDFIENADKADRHARFWAADLVYTSSAGTVTNKAEIMKGFEEAPAPADENKPAEAPAPADAKKPAETPERYTAEDILVRPYGDAAAVTFRLVRHAADGTRHYYRNSGMLLRRGGKWEVVTWQATRVPEEPAK
jgi:hypothetical protein